jgi:hypothetical protein
VEGTSATEAKDKAHLGALELASRDGTPPHNLFCAFCFNTSDGITHDWSSRPDHVGMGDTVDRILRGGLTRSLGLPAFIAAAGSWAQAEAIWIGHLNLSMLSG